MDRPIATRRDVLTGAGVSLLFARSGMAASPDRFAAVDPEMVDDLRLIDGMEVSAATLDRFRRRPAARQAHSLPPSPVAQAPLAAATIPGLPGEPPVRIVSFDGAPGRRDRAAVGWMHGGGYVAGTAGVPVALRLAAQRHGWLVVSIDYRLAPEARFPAALHDNYAALLWVYRNAAALGVDTRRIAVGGASAGGGHAAALALLARDRGEVPVAYQVLIYPMLDDRTGSSRAARPGTGAFVWTAPANRFGWSSLLGRPAGGAGVPAAAVPARRRDLSGLPPTFIGVGTLDLFLDEDIAYAAALTAAGVRIDLLVVPAAFHAFDGIAPASRAARTFTERWVNGLTAALA